MIQENELRIGNYLYYEGTTQVAKVQLLNAPNVVGCRDEYGSFTPNTKHEAIPLTEQILLKCGFEGEDSNIYVHASIGSVYLMKPFKNCEHYLVKYGLAGGLTSLKYVHQLQNLYFALTGVYFGEVDHVIPWQIDHLICWRS